PAAENGIIPFWFWNDDITEEELVAQIRAFHHKGFGGFMPQARVGLSRRVGYLTDEYFRLMKIAVKEAAKLDMKVVLYDEGSYPSGSAQGRVVAENPAYASRCLFPLHTEIVGPAQGYWHPNPGRAMQDQLYCVIQARETEAGELDPTSLTPLEIYDSELVRYEVPEGKWRLIACWQGYSGGTIRGVFDEEEDKHASPPAAGDLLNPDAVASFIRHTHFQYYAHLAEYFGNTIVALFTDEPNLLGRSPKRGSNIWPFSYGVLDDLQQGWSEDVIKWLPALWFDCGAQTEAFRDHYTRTIEDRVERVFYGAQQAWCEAHGIALTGHPDASNEMGILRRFGWPGQDMVWRWVLPNTPSALEGAHSAAPKCASSAAALQNSPRNTTEPLGAYGWQLTLDEAKWLLDWHLVRGNNMYFLHACFYSLRERRAYESEPDIGIHNVWWPYFDLITLYLRRLSWLLSGGQQIAVVAILTDPHHAGWRAAKVLYQNQVDFIYINPHHLPEMKQAQGTLSHGKHNFQAIVYDTCSSLTDEQQSVLQTWQEAGGLVIENWQESDLIGALTAVITRDLDWPNQPDLRYYHYQKEGVDFYLMVNEGETRIEGDLSLATKGALELWDPLSGSTRPWAGQIRDDRLHTYLHLERRQGLVLAVDPAETPTSDVSEFLTPDEIIVTLDGVWQVVDDKDESIEDIRFGQDWARLPKWELFSGRIGYKTEFYLSSEEAEQAIFIDLGDVGDIAEVILNDWVVGVCAWSPYILPLQTACREGINHLYIRVTNSMANKYEGMQKPSGLFGPVDLRGGKALPKGRK
ncbi:MAG: glycosyl hydrolase, partial [Chloroflexota bacterium]